jgi:D-alanine transaminase
MHDPLVYLNGALTPLSEAKIPVLDRGFIFGDGIYEVVPLYRRKLFRAEQHLARLFRSLAAIEIDNPYRREQWMHLISQVASGCQADDQLVYIQVTRGIAKRMHAFPQDTVPTVFIMANPLVLPSQTVRDHGARCVTLEDKRWLRCDIKSTSLLGNVLAAQHAAASDAVETIQFRDGFLTEAASSNVWIAKNGILSGPPKDNLILEGIRYGLIEEFCSTANIPLEARPISREEVFAADEVLLSSASKEILPVTMIDDQTIGNGQPGPMYHSLYTAYQAAKAAL